MRVWEFMLERMRHMHSLGLLQLSLLAAIQLAFREGENDTRWGCAKEIYSAEAYTLCHGVDGQLRWWKGRVKLVRK